MAALDNPLLDAALDYARRGWRVIPLHNLTSEGKCSCQIWRDEKRIGACPTPAKHPRFKGFMDLASIDPEQIRAWWRSMPAANVGIIGGKESGIWALDTDPRNGGEESRRSLVVKHEALPYTLTARTGGGGTHEYFQWPPDFDLPAMLIIDDGLEIVAEGHVIVAAPSYAHCPPKHPTGKPYAWEPELGPDEISPQPAPAWLLDLLRNAIAAKTPAPAAERKPGDFPLADIGKILRGCAWMAHCSDDAATLGEPEWYAQLSVLGRCVNGEQLAHELSKPHPEYSASTTAEKLRRAIACSGPVTCAKVCHSLGGSRFCGECPNAGKVKSPVVLGIRAERSKEAELSDSPEATFQENMEAAIAAQELGAVYRLAPGAARLGAIELAVLKARLKKSLKDFSVRDFERILNDVDSSSSTPEVVKGVGANNSPDLLNQQGGPEGIRQIPLTDSGNAERMVILYGSDFRYCLEMKKWFVWSEGQRFAVDEAQTMKQRAKTAARLLYAQAVNLPDHGFRETVEKWARKSESAAGINATLAATEHEPGVPISALDLDTHPYLLNCMNGVLDLKSGDLLPHDPSFLITKLAHANYNPKARCPVFLRFLERIMGANPEAELDARFLERIMGANPEAELDARTAGNIAFLQRAFGCALTADVSMKAVFCFFGKGNNGKSTLLEAFTGDLLREYSAQINIDTLLVKPGGENNATLADLADLRGARLVTTSEPEEGQRLKVGKLKYLSAGMGEVKSCKKFENPIQFKATHKLFLDGNHRPVVPAGGDEALWSRLKPVPFKVIIPAEERDGQLGDKLKAEAEGILAWAVRGCALWLANGLGDPPDVGEEKEDWRSKSDPLKDFLEDCCEVEADGYCRVSDLTHAYLRWCEEAGEKYPLNRVKLVDQLEQRGLRRTKGYLDGSSGVRMWKGVTVRAQYLPVR